MDQAELRRQLREQLDETQRELAGRHVRLLELPGGDRTAQIAAWLAGLALRTALQQGVDR